MSAVPLDIFTVRSSGEPHLPRRIDLLARRPDILELHGFDRAIVAWTALAVATQFTIAWLFQRLADRGSTVARWWVVVATAYAIGAVLAHWGGVALHDASHNLCARTSWGNRWVGILANLTIPIPVAMSFRRYHLGHHRYMGIQGRDNDLPSRFEVVLGRSVVGKILWLLTYPIWGPLARARGFLRRPGPWEVVGFAVQMAVNVLVVTVAGWTAFAYLLLSFYFGNGPHPVAGHLIYEHYLWNGPQETCSYYGPLNMIIWNTGYLATSTTTSLACRVRGSPRCVERGRRYTASSSPPRRGRTQWRGSCSIAR